MVVHEGNPWWRRIWVLQEVALSPKALLFCGDYQTDYAALTSFLPEELESEINYGNSHNAHQYYRELIHGEVPSLGMTIMPNPFELFTVAQSSLATNPRDRVYGILGLLQVLDRDTLLLPRLDFDQPVATTFTDLTVRLIQYTRTAALIMYCNGETNSHNIPSWVPDWSSPLSWKWSGSFEACVFKNRYGERSKGPPYLDYRLAGQIQTLTGRREIEASTIESALQLYARSFCTLKHIVSPTPLPSTQDSKHEFWCHV